jgi:hypothetical protein
MQPGKKSFDFPAAFIAPQVASILGFRFLPAPPMGRNHFDALLIMQSLIKIIAVVGFITYHTIRCIIQKTVVDGLINQFYFMGRGAFDMSGDRKTRSVCNCHDLGALPAFRIADSTPLFCGAEAPVNERFANSIPPRSYRSSASSLTMRWKTPCRTHYRNRRWHVWYC